MYFISYEILTDSKLENKSKILCGARILQICNVNIKPSKLGGYIMCLKNEFIH